MKLMFLGALVSFLFVALSACGGGKTVSNPAESPSPVSSPQDTGPQTGISEGDLAPDFPFLAIINDPAFTASKLSDLRGRVVLVNFWASWCPYCDAEMPSLEALYNKYKDRGFVVLGVDSLLRDETKDKAAAYMQDKGLTFPSVIDVGRTAHDAYRIKGIPTSFLLDKNGVIIAVISGSRDWNIPAVHTELERLLQE